MSRPAVIVWKCIGVSIMAAILIAAVVWGYKMRPTDAPCGSIRYLIEDSSERLYLSEKELDALLKANDIYPVGKALNILSLHRIETVVRHHPMVRSAECYLTSQNEVQVRLTQRVPLLRVQTPIDTFLIDTDRRVMMAKPIVRDSVLLVTGNVGAKMATTSLPDFAEWLLTDDYWPKRIHHLRVQTPHLVYLYCKGNVPRVVMGAMSGYETKLRKLRTFLENGKEATKDKNYYELDIRYRGQVIGRFETVDN